MSPWLVALLAGVAFALLQYGGRDLRFGRSAILPALLRVAAIALLVGLLLDAAAGRQKPLSGWVALDASASWQRGGDAAAWREARREASAARPESLFLFGDSLRAVRTVPLRAGVEGREGPALVRAIVHSPGDAEPRNDTLAMAIDLSRAASAVFVSTSPDFDARYALSVLRGALAVPTRGYFRVAPGAWRVDGSLTPVAEVDV